MSEDPIICPQCGHESSDPEWCDYCGANLGGSESSGASWLSPDDVFVADRVDGRDVQLEVEITEIIDEFATRRLMSGRICDGATDEIGVHLVVEEREDSIDRLADVPDDLKHLFREPIGVGQNGEHGVRIYRDTGAMTIEDMVDIAGGRLSFPQIRDIFCALLDAVEEAHARNHLLVAMAPWTIRVEGSELTARVSRASSVSTHPAEVEFDEDPNETLRPWEMAGGTQSPYERSGPGAAVAEDDRTPFPDEATVEMEPLTAAKVAAAEGAEASDAEDVDSDEEGDDAAPEDDEAESTESDENREDGEDDDVDADPEEKPPADESSDLERGAGGDGEGSNDADDGGDADDGVDEKHDDGRDPEEEAGEEGPGDEEDDFEYEVAPPLHMSENSDWELVEDEEDEDGDDVDELGDTGILTMSQENPHNPDTDIEVTFEGIDRLYDMGQEPEEVPVIQGFSPPELLGRVRADLGRWCDVFGLGMVLYFLISGKIPPASVYTRYAPAIPVRNFRPGFPPGLQPVLARATRPSPADRYPDIGSMRDAFLSACSLMERRAEGAGADSAPRANAAVDTHVGIAKGKRNPVNQDSVFGQFSDDGLFGVVVVADGVSTASYGSGDLASDFLVQRAEEVWEEVLPAYLMDERIDEVGIISGLLESANDDIVEYVNEHFEPFEGNPHEVMGTTALIAVIHRGTVTLASLGDSRAYVQNTAGLEQVTTDHNLWTLSIIEGVTADTALAMPHGDALARCLGTFVVEAGTLDAVPPEPDFFRFSLAAGDTLLMTTDGLVDFAGANPFAAEENILAVLLAEPDPALACLELILLGNRGGGGDNIGLGVVRFG